MTYRTSSEPVPATGQLWRLPSGKLVELMGRTVDGASWSWSGFSGLPNDYGTLDALDGCELCPPQAMNETKEDGR